MAKWGLRLGGRSLFEALCALVGIGFAAFFFIKVLPPVLATGDVVGAFAAGFVNPFAAGYSTDVILCAVLLAIWIFYERQAHGVKYGWIAIVLSVVPGVATGFALYLILRSRQLSP